MTSLNFESITDQIRSLLQREIEAGKLKPGARIREAAYAEKLGVSKSTLRFALYQLQQAGIIRIEPRKGFYVAVPTKAEMIELLEMREVLEGLAARRAATRSNAKTVRRLQACFADFDQSDLERKKMEFAAADHLFHRRLAEASGSEALVKTLEAINIQLHMNRLRARISRHHDLVPLHREHLAIIEAIDAKDAERAECLAAAHVANVPWASFMQDENTGEQQSVESNDAVNGATE